jgi:hypothetical protein
LKGRSSRMRFIRKFVVLPLLLACVCVGLSATPAMAGKPSAITCTTEGATIIQTKADGTRIVWRCTYIATNGVIIREWIGTVEARPEERNNNIYSDSSPPYIASVNSLIGHSNSGGIGIADASFYHPSGQPLVRRIAVQMTIRNLGTGSICAATGWVEAPTQRSTFDIYVTKPLVGYCPSGSSSGTYYTRAQARFFSTSQNRWITTPVVSSPGLFFGGVQPAP